jgi:hypothetical protein
MNPFGVVVMETFKRKIFHRTTLAWNAYQQYTDSSEKLERFKKIQGTHFF